MTQEDFTTTTDRELQLLVDHGTTPTVRDAARVELARRRAMDVPDDATDEAGQLVVECRLTPRHCVWLELAAFYGCVSPSRLVDVTECEALVLAGLFVHEPGLGFTIPAEKRELAVAVAGVLV